ncbi:MULTISPECIES: flagellar biosynthesis protein FlhA [unclassified Roseateles]|uniref:flagellar biosynthesis protein FlhA n=1 Tax=unclassified Roseateles TaxID=2626991 RepID=UPI0006FA688D|nr:MULTISPECIES: flagellar biosynthesis protein FlhA [unclassified Roseateles]KQW51883.1 flagellar biosynthesis protein FlhA [Pelomonas sp. Root405]KRA78116.1 flagellar biosynthesis protein FlhA [Pelomonas sp. Root662]
MNQLTAKLQALLGPRAGIIGALGAPIAVLLVLAMMVLPLPPFVLDLLFTFNIAMAVMVTMVAANMIKPLDFAAFPTVLLLTTLMRLSLNVASTRVVLLEGHTGTGAAGKVIEAFGHFLIGGNFAVGLIVFAILVVINFIVVTKGAERIAEVGARFTLDAMPGKQMAVDADLNAGLINEAEAKRRRSELGDEADFFGSMDGASKFVRGDAIAGMLILVINIVGGFIIGVAQHNLSASQAANSYILLAVGDALVAQIPALLISVAAAMVVSRVGTDKDIGSQIGKQVFGSAKSLAITAGVIGALGLIPGMPHVVFLLIAAGLGYLAYWLRSKEQAAEAAKAVKPIMPSSEGAGEASWEDLVPVDTLGLEVGYRLITLVDKSKEGDLLSRIKGVRRKFAQEVGFLPPPVHIRDNLELRPSQYRISLRGAVVGEAEAFPGMWLAINPGHATQKLLGTQTTDPAFGLPAVWIEERQKEMAQMSGFTVVDCSTVVATHLSHLMQVHAAKLLGRVETQALVEHLTKQAPQLIEDVIPKMVSIATLQRVLQLLLEEGVHVRDMRSIVECLAEHAPGVTDPQELARRIRTHIAPAIVQQIYGSTKELDVIALEPELERLVTQALNSPHGAALDPGVADTLARSAADNAQKQEDRGVPATLLVPDLIRAPMARLLKRAAPRLKVLGHSEIPETHTIRIGSIIGGTA